MVAAACVVLFAALSASAQTFQNLGPRKCLDCHDHAREKQWAEKEDGPPPNNHLNALKQLEADGRNENVHRLPPVGARR